jgi:glycosyltransferase involved in cell wall biosynthesis
MKGVDVIYECAQRMQNVVFVLVGDGSLKTDVKNCKFVGPRPHDEMPIWMNAADILLLPSRSEGTPNVLMEALSCGIPVICSGVGGCEDLIKDGQTGYCVPIENVDMLQKKITYLLHNNKNRNSRGKEGRKHMIETFDNRKITERIKQIYIRTLNGRNSDLGE